MSGFDVSLPPASGGIWEPPTTEAHHASAGSDSTDAQARILTVCTGNICRSPMAESLLRARLADLDVRVHSAGTHALVGEKMPTFARELSRAHGAAQDDIEAHRARWLVEPVAEDADLILAMSREHRTAAVEFVPRLVRQTFTVREFARLAAGLSPAQIRAAADAAGTTARARMSAAVTLVADQRGVVAPGLPEDDDVIDPYRRDRRVYEASAAQLVPAVDEVTRVLQAALT
ncbi:MAG: low molecular weight phosphatase family protein [Actinomycetota bacterium]